MIWINEEGVICRPHDAQYGTDIFTEFHGKRSAPYLDMIRNWVRTGAGAMEAGAVREHQPGPSEETQLSRAERALGWFLYEDGRKDAAARHFEIAGELAPRDWTIRRGSMPMLGIDPFGEEFFELYKEGAPRYSMDAVTPTRGDPD